MYLFVYKECSLFMLLFLFLIAIEIFTCILRDYGPVSIFAASSVVFVLSVPVNEAVPLCSANVFPVCVKITLNSRTSHRSGPVLLVLLKEIALKLTMRWFFVYVVTFVHP